MTIFQVGEIVIPDRSHHGRDENQKPKRKMKLIKITDPADKNSTLIFASLNGKLSPLGHIICECSTEWAAYDAAGNFINWFGSKKQAIAAL